MTLLEQNKQLYARAGFGISLQDFANPKPVNEIVEKLLTPAKITPFSLVTDQEWAENNWISLMMIEDPANRQAKFDKFKTLGNDLNLAWMKAMVEAPNPLVEKMAIFWHGHFATRYNIPYYDQKIVNIYRANSLGSFATLLKEISKTPSMLMYLNNDQNKKQHPNENFAREVMELFTLGRGNYTEQDIKEAARAFTGWGVDEQKGDFVFRETFHDETPKTFMGQTGNFNGDDIINMLLKNKQTAIFITGKIYKYLVSDVEQDTNKINALAEHFYASNYDISALLKEIFTADWFYADDIQGAKIKSPVELLVSSQQLISIQQLNPINLISAQNNLGQWLFNPPNVAGWPGGKNWIDSGTLVIRMHMSRSYLGSSQLKLDWSNYITFWKKYKREDLPAALASFLLPVDVGQEKINAVVSSSSATSIDDYIKLLTVTMMQLPEYQLC